MTGRVYMYVCWHSLVTARMQVFNHLEPDSDNLPCCWFVEFIHLEQSLLLQLSAVCVIFWNQHFLVGLLYAFHLMNVRLTLIITWTLAFWWQYISLIILFCDKTLVSTSRCISLCDASESSLHSAAGNIGTELIVGLKLDWYPSCTCDITTSMPSEAKNTWLPQLILE